MTSLHAACNYGSKLGNQNDRRVWSHRELQPSIFGWIIPSHSQYRIHINLISGLSSELMFQGNLLSPWGKVISILATHVETYIFEKQAAKLVDYENGEKVDVKPEPPTQPPVVCLDSTITITTTTSLVTWRLRMSAASQDNKGKDQQHDDCLKGMHPNGGSIPGIQSPPNVVDKKQVFNTKTQPT